ncbi:MAG: DNA polymerase/3'-5' exonuclease PolX [Candidatus Berkelbacteria bacterium]|nr:DNA polymerase/3'-5' exonuclease PolX [Candidatus Berkelbacteria bacterium]
MVSNSEFAKIFEEFSEILELKDANRFRIAAYQKASQTAKSLGEPIEQIYERGGAKELDNIPGIGKGIAQKIEEYIKTGRVKELEGLRKSLPRQEVEYMRVPGIGPKTATKLHKEFRAKDLADLKSRLEKSGSKYFKEKTLANILRGIEVYKGMGGRMLLVEAREIAREAVEYLEKSRLASKVTPVGSLRRFKETVGDIDIVAIAPDPKKAIEYFSKFPGAKEVISKGEAKGTIIHRLGAQVDFEIMPEESFGSLLQHFTGSKEHNIHLRTYAQEHGMSVSEHGIKKGKKLIRCRTEEEVYGTLGMKYIEPELREDRGEIEAALNDKLPELIEMKDIKGDFHVHSNWSDGNAKIEDLARKAVELGHKFLAISDHTVTLGIARGLDSKRFNQRRREIESVRKKYRGLNLFDSCEVNIGSDGSLDLPDEAMKYFDVVTASIHSGFNQSKEQITKRMIRAMENAYVDVIGHPTGRLINRREGYSADWEQVFKTAAQENVALEINASPDRLDLPDGLVLKAKKMGVRFAISTDSHSLEQLSFLPFGISVARRGWCEKKDIVNALELEELIKWLRGG